MQTAIKYTPYNKFLNQFDTKTNVRLTLTSALYVSCFYNTLACIMNPFLDLSVCSTIQKLRNKGELYILRVTQNISSYKTKKRRLFILLQQYIVG